jgi:hypothetical protein
LGDTVNEGLVAVHKALLAAQACLDAAQSALVAALTIQSDFEDATTCPHPPDARINVTTMGSDSERDEFCNACGKNI